MEWLSWRRGRSSGCCSWCTEAMLRAARHARRPDRSVTEEEIAASLEEGAGCRRDRGAGAPDGAQRVPPRRAPGRLDDDPARRDRLARRHGAAGRPAADHRRGRALALPGVPRRPRRRARRRLGADACCSSRSRARRCRCSTHLQPPVFVPETLSGMELLEHFRASSSAARVRRRRVRRGAGRDHRARRAGGHHRRVHHRGRATTPGPCSATTAAGCSTA